MRQYSNMRCFPIIRHRLRVGALAFLIASGFVSGCTPPAEYSEKDSYPFSSMIFDTSGISAATQGNNEQYLVPNTISDQCNVSLYLDATKSMQGFISLEKPGNYEKVLQELEDTAFLTFANSSFSYYRFWEKPQNIERDQFRTEAFTPEFYKTKNAGADNDATQTSLLNVFQAIGENIRSPENDMAIIVSDLVSTSKSDRSDMAKYLNDKFLRQGYAIAILGIQAEFSGKVFDIIADGANYTFNYLGTRPYYLVMIGDIANIRAFIGQFESRISSKLAEGQYEKILIFNQVLSEASEPSIGRMTVEDKYKVFVNSAPKEALVSADYSNQPAAIQSEYVQLFSDLTIECPEMSTPGFSITWSNPYEIDPDSILGLQSWNYSSAASQVSGYEIDQDSGKPYDPEKVSGTAEIDKSPADIQLLQVSENSQSKQVTLPIRLIMEKMLKDQAYMIRVDLYGHPTFVKKDLPGWINSWSMNFGNLNLWLSDKSTFQGNATPYLNDLVSTLWDKCASESVSYPALPFGSYYMGFISCEPSDKDILDACLAQLDSIK